MSKKYSVIYADPPWAYRVWSGKGAGRSAEQHYPTMSMEDIKALPVSELAAEDCALFLWVTLPMLREARRRIEALMGDVSRVELFARQYPPGWDVWGNEIESGVTL